jgi:hypothetical protein
VAAAPAEHRIERALDVRIARFWILVEEHFRGHQDAVHAVAALCGLLLDERCLKRVRFLDRPEAIQRLDVLIGHGRDRNRAGAYRIAVHDHRAGAALRQAATEPGAVLVEIVAQHVQQRRGWLSVDHARRAVDS